jgi:hypothetical protein
MRRVLRLAIRFSACWLAPGCVTSPAAGCISLQPAAPTAGPLLLDDPRVQVARLKAGEPAPGDGVWMNEFTFEAVIEAAKGADDEGGLHD